MWHTAQGVPLHNNVTQLCTCTSLELVLSIVVNPLNEAIAFHKGQQLVHSLLVSQLLLHKLHLEATCMYNIKKLHRACTAVPTYIVHACVCAHKNQGGVRQVSGPWTVVLSLVTLIGRVTWPEHQKNSMYNKTHVQYMYSYAGEMVYVKLWPKKGENTPLCRRS